MPVDCMSMQIRPYRVRSAKTTGNCPLLFNRSVLKEIYMKLTGLTTFIASVTLGLSLAAWASTPCGLPDKKNNPSHTAQNGFAAGTCHYANGHLVGNGTGAAGCNQDFLGTGGCLPDSFAQTMCAQGKHKFTQTPYTSAGCPGTGTDSAAYPCTAGTPVIVNAPYAYDTHKSCVTIATDAITDTNIN